jgi:nucleotide-binding universal stress UspA family protein
MSAPDPGSPRRILIALDSCHECRGTLELAAALAAGSRAELVTLFIEDLNLIHAAAMPFVLEVDPVSGGARPFGEEELGRALRREMERVRKELQRISAATSVNWSIKVVRGRYLDEAVAAAEVDVLFMSGAAGARRGRAPRREPPRGEVCLLHDGSGAAARALSLARDLAAAQKLGIRIFTVGGAGNKAVREQARELENAAVTRIESGADLAAALVAARCHVLLTPRTLASRPATGVARDWMRRLDCPVVLVP